jgi:hypothetical protein
VIMEISRRRHSNIGGLGWRGAGGGVASPTSAAGGLGLGGAVETSVTGKVIEDPATGEPLPDISVRNENESLQAQLAEAYGEALAEKERELADLRAQLARAETSGRPALTALAGKAEEPGPG